jgi:glycosyltransferase involved in cell wall biosynthesis
MSESKSIVMFSMTPLFPDKSMGGAQKQLKKVALHLAEEGHRVTILCTRRSDAMQPFQWHENLKIIPIYRFKQPFPEPYATPAYNIASALQDTSDYLREADVFYSHDGGLIFPYTYQDVPTVVSLRSVLFSETLQSGFLFQGDTLIVPSEHTANIWKHTAGRFFEGYSDRLRVIHNGLDFEQYTYSDPTRNLTERIPINAAEHRILLYPHRPEEAKGILQTIELVDVLVHQHGLDDIVVLMPRWIDTGVSAEVRNFYRELEDDIDSRGLMENFIFHDWIDDSLMPEYYSLGDLTIAIGNYVETFGNVPYESLACGTPVLVSRVGTYREMLPEEHVAMVEYDHLETAAEKAAAILKERTRVSDETLTWLHDNFKQSDMVAGYADAILNAEAREPMRYQAQPLTDETRFRLAPWCYISNGDIYHDFKGRYYPADKLITLLTTHENRLLSFQTADRADIMQWYREGLLVPLQAQAEETSS